MNVPPVPSDVHDVEHLVEVLMLAQLRVVAVWSHKEAAVWANLTQDVPVNARSSLMSSSHQRRRQHEEVHPDSDKRFLLWVARRIQVHLAPGRPDGVSEAVLESLERALTVLDTSDDEPLVRAVIGRHVVRRLEQSTGVWFDRLDSSQ